MNDPNHNASNLPKNFNFLATCNIINMLGTRVQDLCFCQPELYASIAWFQCVEYSIA